MNARCRTWKPRNQRAYHEALAQDSAKPLLQVWFGFGVVIVMKNE